MPAFAEILSPRVQIFGLVIHISTIAWPLIFLVIPFLLGLVAEKSKTLGLLLFVIIPFFVSLQAYHEGMTAFRNPNPKVFEFIAFTKLLAVLLPSFLFGFFAPILYKKARARA